MSFSRLRFETYAADLSKALLELSDEQKIRTRPDPVLPVPNRKNMNFFEKRQSMSEVIQPNRFKQDDQLIPSLTGAGSLAIALTDRIAAAKAKFAAANTKVNGAFTKLDSASVAFEQVAEKIEKEADAALSQIGQISNG